MEKYWIEILRKRFSDKKASVPEGLWDDIITAMTGYDKPVVVQDVIKNSRSRIFFIKRAAAVAACIAVMTGIWYFSDKEVADIVFVTGQNNHIEPVVAGQGKSLNEYGDDIVSDYRFVTKSCPADMCEAGQVVFADENIHDGPQRTESEVIVKENTDSCVKMKEVQSVTGNNGVNIISDAGCHDCLPHVNDDMTIAYSTVKRKNIKVDFGFYSSNFTSFTNGSDGGDASYGNLYVQSDMVVSENDIKNFRPFYEDNFRFGNNGAATKIRHRHPVKFGISVRYRLTDRLGVESGINYSYLSSDITTNDGYGSYTGEQRLHYVGIPFNLSYNLLHDDHLDVYVSGGVMTEFCVSGRYYADNMSESLLFVPTETRVRDTRPQFSVNVSPGIQYNISRQVGIFAEPGVGYYFDNGSDVITIYKDKPLIFNFSLGMRFSVK